MAISNETQDILKKVYDTDLGKIQLFSSIENYVALLKANFEAFSD